MTEKFPQFGGIAVFHCAACNWEGEGAEEEDYEAGYVCPVCGSNIPRVDGERPARWHGIALYQTFRAYGGPEEGGWYYTEGYIEGYSLRCFKAEEIEDADKYRAQLQAFADAENEIEKKYCNDRRWLVVVKPEEHPAGHFPAKRPYYC